MSLTYPEIGAEVGRLVAEKQEAYGDSFGQSGAVLRVLYPSGIPPEKLDDALAVVRVVDKLFRIATDRDALGESPWRDIAGYALLALARASVVASCSNCGHAEVTHRVDRDESWCDGAAAAGCEAVAAACRCQAFA